MDRLRADIDRGATGDKVPGSDPAAAPLGTDDEAAGMPPTRQEIALEARSRTVLPQPKAPASRPMPWMIGVWILVAALVVIGFSLGL